MPKHSILVTKVSVHPRMKPDDLLDVSAFDKPDGDLLFAFYGFLNALDRDRLVDRQREMYTALGDISPRGRTIVAEVEGGNFGTAGVTRDVDNHEIVHQRDPNMAATYHARLVVFVPRAAKHALILIERVGREVPGRRLLDLFMTAFKANYGSHMLKYESIVESDAWMQAAELDRVTGSVNQYNWSADIADASTPRGVGRLERTLRPDGPGKHLPKSLLDLLRAKRIDAGHLLGFPDNAEPDELEVQVSAFGRSKTFVIDKEKSPRFAQVIAETGDPTPTAETVRKACVEIAPDLFRNVGVAWETRWEQGVWTPEQLKTRLEVPDE
ncbi:hypothetical protein GCM10010522_67630 [Kribbella solani]